MDGEALGSRHPRRWAYHIPLCTWGGVGAVPQHGTSKSHLLLHGAAPVTILCWQGPCCCVLAPFLLPQVLVGAVTPRAVGQAGKQIPNPLSNPWAMGITLQDAQNVGGIGMGGNGEASRCSPHELPSAQEATGAPWRHPSPTVT